MSIAAQIAALEAAGQLTRYTPRSGVARRRLYLSREAKDDLTSPSSATNLLAGKGYVLAALDRWAEGRLVHGNGKRGLFLDRLDPPPPEIWEIRVVEPRPQVRLFGRFAEPDTLILTKFHTRPYLGAKGSAAWAAAMKQCCDCWDTMFPAPPFIHPHDIRAYVTENCDDFPI